MLRDLAIQMMMAAAAATVLAGCDDDAAQNRLTANESASVAEVLGNDAAAGGMNDASPTNEVAAPKPSQPGPSPAANPCRIQDGNPVTANRIRALGTEPFWNARVEGRCVTYTTPEDLKGTRIWTKFSGTAESGSWTGALDGKPFVLRIRPQPGCSDGMSDNRYPFAASLTVRGEERTGCGEPISPLSRAGGAPS